MALCLSLSQGWSDSHSDANIVAWCFSSLSAEKGSLFSVIIESIVPA